MLKRNSSCVLLLLALLTALLLAIAPAMAETGKPKVKPKAGAKTSARARNAVKTAPAKTKPVSKPAATVTAAAATPAPQQDRKLGLQMDKDFQKLPTFVSSNSLTLDTQKRLFTYSGKVEVKHGDMTLTCDELQGNYDEQNQIQTMVAQGNVIILKGENMKATGQKGVYNRKADTLTISENPLLEQNGSTLSATAIKIFLADNRSVAEGDVRVKLENKDDGKALPLLGKTR